MVAADRIDMLLTWTPFLAEGLVLNLLISFASVLLGTVLGVLMAPLRLTRSLVLRWPVEGTTALMRNVPSFVLLYFMAFVIPREVTFSDAVYGVPSWIKATLALAIPVTAFVADQNVRLDQLQGKALRTARAAYVVSWIQYFLIIFMASATASVIGVSEMVSRANTVIAAVRDPGLVIWIYGYVALWFLAAGGLFSGLQFLVARILHTDIDDTNLE